MLWARELAEKAYLNVIKVSVAYFTICLPQCTLITENSNRVESSQKEEGKSETNTLIWRFWGARFSCYLPAQQTNGQVREMIRSLLTIHTDVYCCLFSVLNAAIRSKFFLRCLCDVRKAGLIFSIVCHQRFLFCDFYFQGSDKRIFWLHAYNYAVFLNHVGLKHVITQHTYASNSIFSASCFVTSSSLSVVCRQIGTASSTLSRYAHDVVIPLPLLHLNRARSYFRDNGDLILFASSRCHGLMERPLRLAGSLFFYICSDRPPQAWKALCEQFISQICSWGLSITLAR